MNLSFKGVLNKYLRILVLIVISFAISSKTYAVTEELFEEWSLDLRDPVSYLEKEVEIYPNDYRLKFVLATLYFELGVAKIDNNTKELAQANLSMLDKAEKAFKEVIIIKKDESLAYYYLGHLAMQKSGSIEQAMEYYKKAIEADRYNYRAYMKLHYLYLSDNAYNDAIELLENSKKYFKSRQEIYYRLGLTYLFIKDYEKAIENAERALSFGKNTETQLMLASSYSLSGSYDKAKFELEDILKTEPKNKTALLGLSAVFSKIGKKEKALEILKKALGFYPDDTEIKNEIKEIRRK